MAINILDYAKKLGIEIPSATATPIDIEAGKAGYEQYLADYADEDAKYSELVTPNTKKILGIEFKTNNYSDATIGKDVFGYYKKKREYESELDWRPNDEWSEEQKMIFGEKYAKDKLTAKSYGYQINSSLKKSKKQDKAEDIAEWSKKNAANGLAASVASLGVNFAGGLRDTGLNTAEYALYGEVREKDKLSWTEVANAMQSGVAENLNEKYGTIEGDGLFGGKGWGDVYGLGMSIGQSAIAGATGGVGMASMFGMAASNATNDALERGVSSDRAMAIGAVAGAAEMLLEKVSFKKLLGIASKEGVQNVFKTVLKQAGQEAWEEGATSVINEVADRILAADRSNYQLTINALMAQGMSQAEAEKEAGRQVLNGIIYDTIAGAASGGISAGGAIGVNQVRQRVFSGEANAKAKELYTPIQQDLIEQGKQYKSSEKYANKLEKKLDKGKELSGYDLRTLAYETENAARTDEVETTRKAIVEQMKAEGLSDAKAKRLGEIALNKAIGHEVSKLQEVQLKNSDGATKVYNQISKSVMDSGAGDSAWAEATPIRKLRAELESQKAAEEMQNGKMPTEMPKATQSEVASPEINSEITTTAKLKQMKNAVVTDAAKLDTLNQLVEESKERGTIGKIEQIKAKNNQAVQMEATASTEQAISEAVKKITDKDLRGKYTTTPEGKVEYKKSKESKLNTDGISSSLTNEDIRELAAIEKIANELGVEIYVYETQEQNGTRVYTDKDGKRYTDSGYYDTKNNTIHIDLRAGMKGEGTMLYTASHEVVHFIKKNASDRFDALEKLVTKALVDGGYSVEKLIEKQKDILKQNGWKGTEDNFDEVAREEMVADACMKFLASKNAVAQIQALKTENKGLWSALKRFFTSFFTKINNVYKNTSPDAPEAEYIGSMYKKAKSIRDAFMEGAVAASKNAAQTQAETQQQFEKNYQKSKDVRKNARYTREHIAQLQSLDASTSTVPMDKLVERYESIIRIWNELGGEINSDFLKQWNDKSGKDRAFTVFKAQAGYKYNVELSSMCKKGIPLFEAIDQIVRSEVMSQLKTKTLGKAEKEVLYELLKERKFDIPCAICYVEQARQREGDIIDAFLDGKVEKTSTGKTKTHKIGWNETFDALEKGMKARGVDYTFADVDRSIASDSYAKETMPVMDEKTQKAFYSTLLQLINKEITRYNAEKDAKTKARMPLKSVTPAEIKRCLGGTLPANLKLYKTIAMNPDSRFRIKNDLLYSSATTTNLASFHHDLYSLFNMQGGVSGYKSKQGAVVYWGDILSKKWDSSKLREEGGVRNQSNSDFMMYTLLDQAQMYIDFTAKGYYLQAYTKVISELKLFGLSKGKINASLIPRVELYRKDNGFEVDSEKTRENAGLDKDGNPIYDDIEGIPHEEAFMLIEDADYSKNIGGICIGYSDKHISKLLDDSRIQLIIGYHDKTDDPDKRYYGARYAKNYNGENEARVKNADGTFTTKHVGFNQFVIAAEKLFKKGVTSTEYNGKTYKYDDIPKLAADMYLKMCQDKNYIPAYDQFSSHENYYKLLADFSLYDSKGHYAPHQKVAYEMPDVVPYLDEDGNKKYMPSREYIKKELEKELTVRDDISATLSDHSENGLIPQFVKTVNEMHESKDIRRKSRITPNQDATYMDAVNRGDMETAQSMVDEAAREAGYDVTLYHGTDKDFTVFKTLYTNEYGYHVGTKQAAEDRVRYTLNSKILKLHTKLGKTIRTPDVFGYFAGMHDYIFYVRGETSKVSDMDFLKQYGRTRKFSNKFPTNETLDMLHNAYVEFVESGYKSSKARAVVELTQEYLKSIGVDSVAYTNAYESKGSTSYLLLHSNQVKSADPVTYDDKGNVIPLSERFNAENKDIRFSRRDRYTSGQVAQIKANLGTGKVYSKASAMKLVSKLAPSIRRRSFDALSDELWRGLNTYTTSEDKQGFAEYMAQVFVDRMMVDTLVKHREWDEANEKLAYLKAGINAITFREEDIPDLQHLLDKKGLAALRGRWGYKRTKNGQQRYAYGLDEFVTDLSREMPGMEYLADMSSTDAMVEIDKVYRDVSEQVKEKYESAYEDAPDGFMDEMKVAITADIMRAYDELGEQTKMSKYLEQKFAAYDERIEYWKAEHAKIKGVSRWNGILATKALHIRELKKGAYYNATQYHQDIFKDSIEKLSQIQWRGNISVTNIKKIMGELHKWYTMENPMLYDKNAPDDAKNVYSSTIAQYIEHISLEDTKFGVDERAMLYEVMNHLYTLMKNYNKVFRNNRWEDAPDLVKNYLDIMVESQKKRSAVRVLADTYNRNFLEPMAIAKQADGYNPEGFYTQTVEDLRQASVNASIGEMRLRKAYDDFIDNHKKYLMNAAKDTVNYRGFAIPKLHLISLYMTMKRKHARAGLALNGFEFYAKNKWWDSEDVVKVPGYISEADGEVTQEMIDAATSTQMSEIEKSLTDTDKEYISILENLFNVELKQLKVERDMARQGYTNATLDYYYPIMRGAIAENIDTARMSDDNRATNASFNKNTVKGSKQYLKIISADAMVNRHIRDMCKYYYMSQAIENFNVLYNCDVSDNANNPISIATTAKRTKTWDKDFDYFKKLINDMQGIREPMNALEQALEGLRGNYAKFALGLNLKVLATQFSSVIAAGNVIGFKSIFSAKALGVSAKDIETYCPLAAVRSYEKTALRAMSLTDKVGKVSEALSIGISAMDNFVIHRLFASCQIEAQKRGEGAIGTEENKRAAGKILEQIIIETQQNSYATERSAAMRSKNALLKALTMFTADGMKVISRIHESAGMLRAAKKTGDKVAIKKARRQLAKSLAVATCIAAYLSALAMAFNWIYDREEEEDENKLVTFAIGTVGNFIGALPFISDLYDTIVNGYEVEDVAFDTLNNIYGALSNLYKDATDRDRSIEDLNRDLRSLLYGVGQVTGIPIRNFYNLTRGIVGKVSSKAGYYIDSKFYETSLSTDFKKSVEDGDASKSSYILGLLYDENIGEPVSSAQKNEIIRLTKLGHSVLPKDIPDKVKRNSKEYVLTSSQKATLDAEYSKVVKAIDKLISTAFYKNLSNDDKAYMIDYYHDKYYDLAVNKALKLEDKNAVMYKAISFDTFAMISYMTKDIESDKDKNGNTISGSKKEKIIKALNKVKMSDEKKLFYLASRGYALSESDQQKLCKYLNSLKISKSEKKELAEMCGLTYKNGKITPKS